MGAIQISTPILKSFTHTTTTVGTSAVQIVQPAVVGTRRVSVIIQNQSAVATLKLIFADASGSDGIIIQPATIFSMENYNGSVWAIASAASTPVHIALSIV